MLTNPLLVFGVLGLAVLGLAVLLWYRSQRNAALVLVGLGVVAFTVTYFSHTTWALEQWRSGSWWRTLLLFLPSAVVFLGLAAARHGHLLRRGQLWFFLLLLTLGPTLVMVVPQMPIGLGGADPEFNSLLWWSLASIAIYVLLPVLYARSCAMSIREMGWQLGGLSQELRLFLILVPALVLIVFLASADSAYQLKYPFYQPAAGVEFYVVKLVAFELLYGLQFVALEFFFRGFVVLIGARFIGVHSVAVMSLSYALIHLGKPMSEMAASFVGGAILGYAAYRYRSIFLGVAAHISIAWGTDCAVLLRR